MGQVVLGAQARGINAVVLESRVEFLVGRAVGDQFGVTVNLRVINASRVNASLEVLDMLRGVTNLGR
jgi:predicted thioesterase